MKNFARRGYRIVDANREMKLVYSFFLVFVLIGFATIVGYQFKVIGWSLDAIYQYYLGNEVALQFPKSFLQLLEVAHSHAFMMGLIYLTLAHIVIATRLQSGTKMLLIIGGFLATVCDLTAPWLIRYGSESFVYLMILAWLFEWIFYLSYIAIPLYDMWIKAPEPDVNGNG
jgi:hypothetical protein